MSLRTLRHPLLAAILALLWVRPYTTRPDMFLVDIGVLILLFTVWPWIASWVDPRLRAIGKSWRAARTGEERAQAAVYPVWPALLMLFFALALMVLFEITGGAP